jgi:regulator of CtrA degradation
MCDSVSLCIADVMFARTAQIQLTRKVIDSLYVEAMVLADEARAYFDRYSSDDRNRLEPVLRVSFSCESLKVTTRLMHIVAWLLTQRALESGEIDPGLALSPSHRLGDAVSTEREMVENLPEEARQLIGASCELYRRVKRLDLNLVKPADAINPAHTLLRQLEQAF